MPPHRRGGTAPAAVTVIAAGALQGMTLRHTATRPWAVAGAGLVAAGLIAATPAVITRSSRIAVAITDIRLALAAAELDLPAPILQWGNVLLTTAEDVRAPFTAWTSAPVPILRQLLVNQVDNVKDLRSGLSTAAELERSLAQGKPRWCVDGVGRTEPAGCVAVAVRGVRAGCFPDLFAALATTMTDPIISP